MILATQEAEIKRIKKYPTQNRTGRMTQRFRVQTPVPPKNKIKQKTKNTQKTKKSKTQKTNQTKKPKSEKLSV
jgi:hypothetical protein